MEPASGSALTFAPRIWSLDGLPGVVDLLELDLPQVALQLAPAHDLVDAAVCLAERRDGQLDRAARWVLAEYVRFLRPAASW
jgi:hypothetical protein